MGNGPFSFAVDRSPLEEKAFSALPSGDDSPAVWDYMSWQFRDLAAPLRDSGVPAVVDAAETGEVNWEMVVEAGLAMRPFVDAARERVREMADDTDAGPASAEA